VADQARGGWWFRQFDMLLADYLTHRRVRKLTECNYVAAKERVGKDEEIRRKAAQVGLPALRSHLEAERERRKSIEEKARANLAAVTIALTIVVVGPASLVAQVRTPGDLGTAQLPIAVLLAIAALYFLWAGHMALKALLLREWWQLAPDEELWDEAKRAEHTWWYILMNQKVTLEKTNALDVSYTGMKSGMVILVLLLFILAILAGPREVGSQTSSRERHPAASTIATEAQEKGGEDLMRLFPGSSWTDLATAAVACISVAGVWWTFWPGHRERLRQRREQRLQRLLELHVQLQHIGHWASTSFDANVHRAEWYNASWFVNPFPWNYVENFNRLVVARDYPRELTEALVALEAAAWRFQDMLADQTEFRSRAQKDIGLRWPAVVAAAEARGTGLATEDLARIADLTDEDRTWLAELYRRNKSIHVEGIGGSGGGGLHKAWSGASSRLHEARASLQAGRDSRWRWAGHILAGIFAVLGLLFLVDFGWSFLAAHRPTAIRHVNHGSERAADSLRIAPQQDTSARVSPPTVK